MSHDSYIPLTEAQLNLSTLMGVVHLVHLNCKTKDKSCEKAVMCEFKLNRK